jgi:hypothetical protein
MSHLIASDALSSPVSDSAPWSTSPDSFFNNYSQSDYSQYVLSTSPQPSSIPDSPVPPLKSRCSSDSSSEGEQLCMSTHQLFNLPVSPAGSVRSPSPGCEDQPAGCTGMKRQGSLLSSGPRKPRERISTKDFIPPDVSGLSKREARLVKNRAAAFLSRQRKREEFETMEVRVAELEQENARLLAITRGEVDPVVSEVEQLRAQLAAAEQRTNELCAQLALKSDTVPSSPSAVKMESFEAELPPSSAPSSRASPAPQYGHKSNASLGLMVLLCALPSLLSLPTQSTVPTTFSLPLSQSSLGPFSSSPFDINSLISNEERDWSLDHGMNMDFDMNDADKTSSFVFPSGSSGKLELANHGSLDISFDAIPSDDGKIRVRIHPPSASSSASSSAVSSPSPSSGFMKSEQEDPFLGVGGFDFDHDLNSDPQHRMMQSVYDFDQEMISGIGGARKRVRIALKGMPSAGREGGEWEVEVC